VLHGIGLSFLQIDLAGMALRIGLGAAAKV